jgi:hypothetical protein
LFDNGTNGDVTAGDNVYSFAITIPAGEDGGLRSISATASDAQDRSVNMTLNITINAPPPDDNPLIFGNPSGATSSISNENNYLMINPKARVSRRTLSRSLLPFGSTRMTFQVVAGTTTFPPATIPMFP